MSDHTCHLDLALQPGACEACAVDRAYDEHDAAVAALQHAIRLMTVDMPDGSPNGDCERAVQQLEDAIMVGDLVAAEVAFRKMCGHWADDLRRLRRAAERLFGEDFHTPLCDGDHPDPPCEHRECWRKEPPDDG